MNLHRVYEPRPPRRRAHLLRRWARLTLWTLIAIPTLYYGIHYYFAMMPVVTDWLNGNQFHLQWVK